MSLNAGSAFVLLLEKWPVVFGCCCFLFVLAMGLFVVLDFAVRADKHLHPGIPECRLSSG